jgi:hypothetical protein
MFHVKHFVNKVWAEGQRVPDLRPNLRTSRDQAARLCGAVSANPRPGT